ncbi:uncharacterized protein LOC125229321 isoform X2 [Leguminivora glycinivorella]|uniref:uncharacterized protein LOC125229321 isoform X2 n=1 Tax=Leguminivora glycinivorella TaxID=1035111 RepID=UPI00200E1866|nr:uncharacterized protein LOC125229321 isoform X2 [Leguminivora glycinivorella]
MSKRKMCEENDDIRRKIKLLELQLLRNSKRQRIMIHSDHENEVTEDLTRNYHPSD